MEKTDARRLNQDTQYEQRKQVIRLREKGMKNKEVAEIVGISRTYASTIYNRYRREGKGAIAKKKRGRREGEQKKLTPEQEKEIQRLIVDKTPDQLRFPFALWTRQAIAELIKRLYEIDIPLRTLTDYLKHWGFSCQKPAKRAYEQQPAAVQHWLDEEYPAVAKQAKQEEAEIYWGDETGIENTAYQDRGFSPIGKTPIIRLNAKKSRVNMISAISNQGQARFMFYKESMNADTLIEFMGRLTKDSDKKIYLILDNLKVHHGKVVQVWLEEHKNTIQVFYLPSYSPELNPDEYLNGNLKRTVHSGMPSRNETELEHKSRCFMMDIQSNPDHIKSYFKARYVTYAA